jgi:hypothetical protein
MRATSWIVVLLAASGAAHSQAVSTPAAGDPELFYLYLRQTHELAGSTIPGKGPLGPDRTAAVMRARAADLPLLENLYQSVTSSVAALDYEVRGYLLSTAAKQSQADRTQLEKYYQRRLDIFRQADRQLRVFLGDLNWSQIHLYIDGEFRTGFKVRGMSWPKSQ